MAGLVPAIHVCLADAAKAWMSGPSPGMTSYSVQRQRDVKPLPYSPAAARAASARARLRSTIATEKMLAS